SSAGSARAPSGGAQACWWCRCTWARRSRTSPGCGRSWSATASARRTGTPSCGCRPGGDRLLPDLDLVPVHLPERVVDQLQARAVRIPEVDRGSALHHVLHAGRVEAGAGRVPVLLGDGDGQVVQTAEHLRVGARVDPGQVEEGDGVAVAEVEEEVGGAGQVPVLEHLHEGETQHVL